MSEKALWTLTRTGIKSVVSAYELHLERMENSVSEGTPDVNYCIKGAAGWIELKFLPDWPKRSGTMVAIEHFTQAQRIFLHNYSMAGGRCFVWIQVKDEYFLFDGLEASMFLGYASKSDTSWRRKDFAVKSLLHFKKGAVHWDQLIQKMTT